MKIFWLSLLVLFARPMQAALDPVELKAKIAAMYLSRSPYCSSPILVFSKSTVYQYDVFGFPTLGVTDNKTRSYDGSYYCIIFKMSEQFSFRANIFEGNCNMNDSHTSDVCTSSHTNTQIDGVSSSCTGASDETVYLYLSTASNSNDPDLATQPFSPPTVGDTSKGIKLNFPFTVSGNVSGRLIIDAINRINSVGSGCSLSMPRFSFVNE